MRCICCLREMRSLGMVWQCPTTGGLIGRPVQKVLQERIEEALPPKTRARAYEGGYPALKGYALRRLVNPRGVLTGLSPSRFP